MKKFKSPLNLFKSFTSSKRATFVSEPYSQKFTVSLFPGDGIGPEISQSMIEIFEVLKVPITWQYEKILAKANEDGDLISFETLQNLRKNRYAVKGIETSYFS